MIQKLLKKFGVLALVFAMLLSLSSNILTSVKAEAEESPGDEVTVDNRNTDRYEYVKIRFSYSNYYIEFPDPVYVGKKVILYGNTEKTQKDVEWTVPAEGYGSEEFKTFAPVGSYEKEGFTLNWDHIMTQDGNLEIWPVYTPKPDTNSGSTTNDNVEYEYNFKWITEPAVPNYSLLFNLFQTTMQTHLSSSKTKNSGLTIDFSNPKLEEEEAKEWINTFGGVSNLTFTIDSNKAFNEDYFGIYTFKNFQNEFFPHIVGSNSPIKTTTGVWTFKHEMDINYEFTTNAASLPEDIQALLPAATKVVYSKSLDAIPTITPTEFETEEGTYTFDGFDVTSIDSVTADTTITGNWTFTPKPIVIDTPEISDSTAIEPPVLIEEPILVVEQPVSAETPTTTVTPAETSTVETVTPVVDTVVKHEVPKTGDSTSIYGFVVLILLSLGAMLFKPIRHFMKKN